MGCSVFRLRFRLGLVWDNMKKTFANKTALLRVGLVLLLPISLFLFPCILLSQDSFTQTAEQVNKKLVKLFGAGGFKGMPAYGTGILVSDNGCILTVNNHILNTPDLRV